MLIPQTKVGDKQVCLLLYHRILVFTLQVPFLYPHGLTLARDVLLLYYLLLSTHDVESFGGIAYASALEVVDHF